MAEMQPDMPSMEGANMSQDALSMMDPKAREAFMQPDDAITSVLLMRMSNMSQQELEILGEVMTPETVTVMLKLLPELRDLIEAVSQRGAAEPMQEQAEPMQEQAGALGGI
jgi:hypothetical protein